MNTPAQSTIGSAPNLHAMIAVIAEPIAREPMRWLAKHTQIITPLSNDRSALLEHLDNAHALIVRTYTIVDDELLDRAPKLRVIARAGVGLDNIDLDACKSRNIRVVHTPKANTHAVVEYVISMILSTRRRIAESIINPSQPLSDPDWHALREASITPRSCVGARLGIIGFGSIGSALARAAQMLSMELCFHDLREIHGTDAHACTSTALDELASSCDIISVHVDGRKENHRFLSTDFFAQLKPDVLLLNTSRGFVIDDQAAADFARSNPRATLILDVHDPEPITQSSPYTNLPNVIRTPHIAAATSNAKEQMSWVVRDVVRVLVGDEPEFPAC